MISIIPLESLLAVIVRAMLACCSRLFVVELLKIDCCYCKRLRLTLMAHICCMSAVFDMCARPPPADAAYTGALLLRRCLLLFCHIFLHMHVFKYIAYVNVYIIYLAYVEHV